MGCLLWSLVVSLVSLEGWMGPALKGSAWAALGSWPPRIIGSSLMRMVKVRYCFERTCLWLASLSELLLSSRASLFLVKSLD